MFLTPMKMREKKGAGLIHIIIIIGVVGILLEESIRMLSNQNEMLQIMRMNQRLAISSEWVAMVGNSGIAMRKSAEQPGNSTLTRCLIEKKCSGDGPSETVTLFDPFGQRVSGLFQLDGQPCEANIKACPISIETKISFQCPEGQSSCEEPEAMHTTYVVQKNPQLDRRDILSRREFKKFENEVILANFTCPKGEYIRAIAENGALQCARPRFSAGFSKCASNLAPTGVLANGMITDCVSVENLCKKSLAVATVLDTSGSMSGSKINVARNVLQDFISAYDESRDNGSLTTFSTGAQIVVDSTKDKSKLKGESARQRPNGATNMGAGLIAGAQSLAKESSRSKIMVFISDGMNNTGETNVGAIADNLKKQGVRIITVGFGSAADPVMLRRIASPGDNFIAPLNADLSKIFGDIKSVLCRSNP